MCRAFIFFALLFSASVASAGPIPWTYSVWLKPPGGSDGILYGTETGNGPFGLTQYYVLSKFGAAGITTTGAETQTGTTDLFGFSNGNWNLATSLPSGATPSNGTFSLQYLFTSSPVNSSTESVSGSFTGTISTSGVFTSGTGNFTLGLDGETEVLLGGQKALVRFGTRESESHSAITMQVTPVAVETPEPGTLILGGIGLASLMGLKFRGRTTARTRS